MGTGAEYPSPRQDSNAKFAFARRQTVRTASSVRSSSFLYAGTPRLAGSLSEASHASSVRPREFRIVGARFEKKSAKWARDSSWAICPIQLPTRFYKKRSLGLVM